MKKSLSCTQGRRFSTGAWSAVVALTLLALVACGSDGDEAAGSVTTVTTAATSEAPTLDGEPIKVLNYGAYQSETLSAPQQADGALAAAKAINANGGVQGRPIEVITCDAGDDPNKSLDCVRDGLAEGVIATVGVFDYGASATIPELERNKLAMVGGTPQSAADQTSPVMYPLQAPSRVNSTGLCTQAAADGIDSVAYIAVDVGAATIPMNDCLAILAEQDIGGKAITVPLNTPDFLPTASQAMAGDPDAIMVGMNQNDTLRVLQSLVQLGFDGQLYLSGATLTEDSFEQLCDSIDGATVLWRAEPWLDLSSVEAPGVAQFVDDMAAQNPDASVDDYSWQAYSAVFAVAQIASELDAVDAGSFYDAIAQASEVELPNGRVVDLTRPNPFDVEGLDRAFTDELTVTTVADCGLEVTNPALSVYAGA